MLVGRSQGQRIAETAQGIVELQRLRHFARNRAMSRASQQLKPARVGPLAGGRSDRRSERPGSGRVEQRQTRAERSRVRPVARARTWLGSLRS
jgi:hypothetical protein